MNQEELRNECSRLIKCETINDSHDLLTIYADFILNAVLNHHPEDVYTKSDSDAKLILQMLLTKTLYLKNLLDGIIITPSSIKPGKKIIDPTVVAILIRSIYETVGLFNLIFRYTKNVEEKKFIHMLWVHSGLKYRQRFEKVIITEANKKKQQNELKIMEEIVVAIENSPIYISLDEENRKKIKDCLKKKKFLIKIENNEIILLHWQALNDIMNIKEGMFDTMYNYFSLYTHPSQVAVFQFGELFQDGESYLSMTNFNVHNAFFLISIFIADYIHLFPTVLETFEKLEIRDQIVINFYNTAIRGQEYSIPFSAVSLVEDSAKF